MTVADKVKQQVTEGKTKFKTFVKTYARNKRSDDDKKRSKSTAIVTDAERDLYAATFVPSTSAPAANGKLSELEGSRELRTAVMSMYNS